MTSHDELTAHLQRALSGSGDRAARAEREESLQWLAERSELAFPTVAEAVRERPDALDAPRWIALLGRLQHAGTDELLAGALACDDEDASLAAGQALAARPGEAARDALVQALVHESSTTRASAVLGLGRRGDPATGPALRERCEDADPIVRYHAVRAAHRLGALAADDLERLATRDPNEDVRELARQLAAASG